jgi:homoserine kinase
MHGESAGCGAAHPDNAAPALYGGFILARGSSPRDVVTLPVPEGVSCAVLHPHLEIETGSARVLLGDTVPLDAAVKQAANVGALVAALFRADLRLLARAMEDHIAEPRRAHLVPSFAVVKSAARLAGALGCSLSGSGPSIFALCESAPDAERIGEVMRTAFHQASGIGADVWTSPVGARGARIVAG